MNEYSIMITNVITILIMIVMMIVIMIVVIQRDMVWGVPPSLDCFVDKS